MLSIGKMNKLTVDRIVDMGAYLSSEQGDVLLPKKYVAEHIRVGDELNVFVYIGFGDGLMASIDKPYGVVGDIVTLRVVDVNNFGAFLDWGMEKDILLPYKRQLKPVVPGQKCVVKLVLDEKTNRVIATSKLRSFLDPNNKMMKPGDEVQALFYDESEIGFTAVINDAFIAMLHRPDAIKPIEIGDTLTVYIKRVLPDGLTELSLRKVGYQAVVESRQQLLNALESAGGFLEFTDKSTPEAIREQFDMSKKAFKRVVGSLYKEKKIKIEDNGIRLL